MQTKGKVCAGWKKRSQQEAGRLTEMVESNEQRFLVSTQNHGSKATSSSQFAQSPAWWEPYTQSLIHKAVSARSLLASFPLYPKV